MTAATNHHPVREYLAIEDYLPTEPGPMPELGEPGADSRERWRRIVLDGLVIDYEVSDYGRVVNPKGHLLKVNYPGSERGTGWIGLPDGTGKNKAYRIDKLVLRMFAQDPPDPSMQPLHLNEDLTDCRLENLVWAPAATVRAQWQGRSQATLKARREAGIAPKPPKKRVKKQAPKKKNPATQPDTVQVTRLYRMRDLALTVALDGSAELTKGSHTMRFTPSQFTALVALAAHAGEMNAVLARK